MADVGYLAVLALVVGLTLLGIFHPMFDDNLAQRVALALIAIGCCMDGWTFWHGYSSANVRSVFLTGVALYGIGTALKAWRYRDRS